MTTVYVVTEGAYSEYHIEAIFTDRSLADAMAAALNESPSSLAQVEEWPLRDTAPTKVVLHIATFMGHASGTDHDPREYTRSEVRISWEPMDYPRARVTFAKPRTGPLRYEGLWVTVEGTDKERVSKALHDKVAELRAQEEGIA